MLSIDFCVSVEVALTVKADDESYYAQVACCSLLLTSVIDFSFQFNIYNVIDWRLHKLKPSKELANIDIIN